MFFAKQPRIMHTVTARKPCGRTVARTFNVVDEEHARRAMNRFARYSGSGDLEIINVAIATCEEIEDHFSRLVFAGALSRDEALYMQARAIVRTANYMPSL